MAWPPANENVLQYTSGSCKQLGCLSAASQRSLNLQCAMRYNSTACCGRYARQKNTQLLLWRMQTARIHTREMQQKKMLQTVHHMSDTRETSWPPSKHSNGITPFVQVRTTFSQVVQRHSSSDGQPRAVPGQDFDARIRDLWALEQIYVCQ